MGADARGAGTNGTGQARPSPRLGLHPGFRAPSRTAPRPSGHRCASAWRGARPRPPARDRSRVARGCDGGAGLRSCPWGDPSRGHGGRGAHRLRAGAAPALRSWTRVPRVGSGPGAPHGGGGRRGGVPRPGGRPPCPVPRGSGRTRCGEPAPQDRPEASTRGRGRRGTSPPHSSAGGAGDGQRIRDPLVDRLRAGGHRPFRHSLRAALVGAA